VSGTIRKAEEEVIRRAKAIIQRAQEAGSGVDGIVKAVGESNAARVQARKEKDVIVVVDDDEGEEESDSEG
jgi:ribonuclease P/MRP protein subunit POP5